ncbi:HDOD domain-containing protein [Alteromonas sp. 5E99-2]|uniref:HDOD domain-containing protein n=1 Tax=Alteromonas sp. 5E99-2 TaxID=2817683 RepID=UPI001A9887BC|nr:HDOD domain-containing protein [Alteromonas sp. 5E99-2]MBO1254341.1 HDOD domain-containing protein [Alteromonas sp. 5E99-2]
MNITLVVVLLLILAGFFLFKVKRPAFDAQSLRNSLLKHRERRKSSGSPATHEPLLKNDECPIPLPNKETQLPKPKALEQFFLVSPDNELESELQRNIVEKLNKPHPVLAELSTQITSSKQLNKSIKKDPELVAKVIKSANSPAFGLKKPITNINHAINYLGLNQVHAIAMQFALKTTVSFNTKEQNQAYQKVWTAGFIASTIALELSQSLSLESAGELATICQLNYLGDLAVIQQDSATSELFISPSNCLKRTHYIQSKFNINQAALASLVAKNWGLPKKLQDSLKINLLPLVGTSVENVNQSPITDAELMVCYISCRIAELLAFNGKADVIEYNYLDWPNTEEVEFYYTGEQLEKANLEKLNNAYSSPEFKRKLRAIYTDMKL